MSRPTLADLSPRYQEQVRAQLERPAFGAGMAAAARRLAIEAAPADSKPRPSLAIRQDRPMNKLEAAFLSYMTEQGHKLHRELVTLKIGNGLRYTPDFVEVDCTEGRLDLTAYETKGGLFRDDAKAKLKAAASQFPWIRFYIATRAAKEDGGQWTLTEVKP